MDVTPADLLAASDMLADINEASDSLSIEDAHVIRQAVQGLRHDTAVTIGLLDTAIQSQLEAIGKTAIREIGSTRYRLVPAGKWRPEHAKVRAAVKAYSCVDENGELRSTQEAVEIAVRCMYELFVGPSQFPKTGGLDQMGLDKPHVGHFEGDGTFDLKVEPVMSGGHDG